MRQDSTDSDGESSLRILIIAPQPFHDDRGTPIAVGQVVSALASLGHRTDVLTFPIGRDLHWENTQIIRCANPLGIQSVNIGFSLKKVALDLSLCVALVRRLRSKRYDLIHAVEEMALPALMLARFHDIPVIYDMQSSLPEQLESHPVFGRDSPQQLLKALERYMLHKAHLVACSAGLLEYIRRVAPGTRASEWRYVAEQLQVPPPIETLQALRSSLGIDNDHPVVLYAGNFEHYQGLTLLVKAIPEMICSMPDVKVVLVGKTQQDRLEPVSDVTELVRQGHLIIVDRQSREQVFDYLAMADVLVSPRLYGNNLPLKLFTYMAAKKAIVATDIAAHRALLEENRGLLVDLSPSSIARGVVTLLQQEDLRTDFAVAAHDYVTVHNSDRAFATRLNYMIRRARGSGRQSRRHSGAPAIPGDSPPAFDTVSVIIPARNEQHMIAQVVQAVLQQSTAIEHLEVLVVDDGSTDQTAAIAEASGAKVITSSAPGATGNPAAARNLGAVQSTGDPIVFLDSDCVVGDNWLQCILSAHARGATIVGGSLALPDGLELIARCDFYCGWYLIHPGSAAGIVPHHPPPNLSVRRQPFKDSVRFTTEPPFDYTNEERFWQAELRKAGHQIHFEPCALAYHHNRPGFLNLLKRNYRWGYTAIEAKSLSGAARMAWLYRYPWLLIPAAPLLIIAHTGLIIICWMRAGKLEPLAMLPLILISRVSYVAGMTVGAVRWLRHRVHSQSNSPRKGPHWR
ncbi:MAG: glycosyltransferase [Granulosicoccus sp.]|nr:glycosyltransferase [Granulosicoccus sp.]